MNSKIHFNTIIRTFRSIIGINLACLLLMTVNRIVFYFLFKDISRILAYKPYLFKAFILGFRFDLVVASYITSAATLLIMLFAIFKLGKYYPKLLAFLKFYFTIMYSFVFLILIADSGFYSYFQNHINILIFGVFEDDTLALFSTIWENYNLPLAVLGYFALAVSIYFICAYFLKKAGPNKTGGKEINVYAKATVLFIILAANVLFARGSLKMFPLGTMDAEISPSIFINKLTLNGVHTLIEAVNYRLNEKDDADIIKIAGYENNIEGAFKDFTSRDMKDENIVNAIKFTAKKNEFLEKNKPNVIVILVEGMGMHIQTLNSGKFNVLGSFAKHIKSDVYFTNFLSGDVGTIGSLESILFSKPKRPNTKHLSQTKHAFDMGFISSAEVYKNSGYETMFFYGGNVGWRNIITYLPKTGFDRVEGEGAMDGSYERNQWGVYDEYLFEHIYVNLSKGGKSPKFIFALTTTNHPPYSLPRDYTLLPLEFPKTHTITGDYELAFKRFQTYQYTCEMIGRFLSRIKDSEFAENTVVAVTGDHNFWNVFTFTKNEYLDLDGVPFYLYIPDKLKPKNIDTSVFGSHIDIMPTLYNLTLSGAEYYALGKDMLNPGVMHISYNVDGIVLTKECGLRYNLYNGIVSYYGWDDKDKRRLVESPKRKEHESMIKYYKSAMAVTDYIIKNPPAKEVNSK